MVDEQEFKIKGAAAKASESVEPKPAEEPPAKATPPPDSTSEDGEVTPNHDKDSPKEQEDQSEQASQEENLKRYRWCKCVCDPTQFGGDRYFLHLDTQESRWDEPAEPYWLWNTDNQAIDDSGLQYPGKSQTAAVASSEPDPEYAGYNPKIHGSYDPNAPYAQYHNRKRQEESLIAAGYDPASLNNLPTTNPQNTTQAPPGTDYTSAGTFNRFTGAFQDSSKSADRHTDAAKSGRQMNAYFDVDAAANMHDGRSLKEERRNEKLSKKQIKELAEKRRAKKEKKRMDFYRS